eukprot:TRINITY_DN55795_c0_g1_i1.p1 TRINITY_DN55795_c0_g1~~TRINITY_DN55795_c0_g1_i1.p1  ORF type:complete len:527 (-),score=52.97 TRINITY_DN55795_c0_g1_i1:52-1443(-)
MAPAARSVTVQLPAFSQTLNEVVMLSWDSVRETTEQLTRRFAGHLHTDGIHLQVDASLDSRMDGSYYHGSKSLPTEIRVAGNIDRKEWRPWHQVAGLIHSIFAVVVAPEEVVDRELEPSRGNTTGKVGIFLLKSPGRFWTILLRSLSEGWRRGRLREAYFHVLVHDVDDWRHQDVRDELGEAWPLFGGIHWCFGEHARQKRSFQHKWENYFQKVYTMTLVARRRKYSHIISLDDDVLLPASVLSYMAGRGRAAAERQGCGVVSPLLQNGVPSVEIWAETFCTANQRERLYQCFEGSSAHWHHDPLYSPELEPLPVPWHGPTWYRRVGEKEPSYFKGVHPVRGNRTCIEIALTIALENAREFDVWRTDHQLLVDHSRVFPYLCNNAFLMRTDLYAEAIERTDLERVNGADEVPMNLLLHERELPICLVDNSFGIHPSYNHHPLRSKYEDLTLHVLLNTDKVSWY